MSKIQEVELKKYQHRISKDLEHILDRYCEIMAWDVPDNDPMQAKKMVLKAMNKALKSMGD